MICRIIAVVLGFFILMGVGFENESGFPLNLGTKQVFAATELNNLNPNEYKEKDFKDNKEYLHNETLLENRKNIRDEQKQLDFTPKVLKRNEKIKTELFVDDFKERKTIAYDSMKYGLFSNKREIVKTKIPESIPEDDSKSNGLQFFYIGLLIACIFVVLLWLVPKMVLGEKS
ncbi:MAG: type VII secretion protein EssA [Solibacillus isronensis]